MRRFSRLKTRKTNQQWKKHEKLQIRLHKAGAPNESIVQNHINIAC